MRPGTSRVSHRGSSKRAPVAGRASPRTAVNAIEYPVSRRIVTVRGVWCDFCTFSTRAAGPTQPNATKTELFRCPWLLASDVGTAGFTAEAADHVRAYLLKGGFLWVDDFWGSRAWEHWAREIAVVLPPAEFPIFDVPPGHPIRRMLFDIAQVPQVPSIQFWRQSGGGRSERGAVSADLSTRGPGPEAARPA